jgi:hypothetical protein
MRWLVGLVLALLVAAVLLVVLPGPVDPVAWTPDPDSGFNNITSVSECDGALYLGSLTMPAVARYPLQ